MPVVDLPDDELAAVVAALRRLIDEDKYPHAPRLDPLRAAMAQLEAVAEPAPQPKVRPNQNISGEASTKLAAEGDKRARR